MGHFAFYRKSFFFHFHSNIYLHNVTDSLIFKSNIYVKDQVGTCIYKIILVTALPLENFD